MEIEAGLPPLPEGFESLVWDILSVRKTIGEYELLRILADHGFPEFKPDLDPLILFRAHFLLFHLLYRLQDRWCIDNRGCLSIHTTDINLIARKSVSNVVEGGLQSSVNNVQVNDTLKAYYLDYNEFLCTQAGDVVSLLDDFWKRMAGFPVESFSQEVILQSQKVLGLQDQLFTVQSVKRQFRLLCQQHHPDKGGDPQLFRKINDAKEVLLRSAKTG